MKNVTANLMIFLGMGLMVFGGFLLWQRQNPKRLQFENKEIAKIESQFAKYQDESNSQPTKITIKDLNIEAPIVPASKDDKGWETTKLGVSYLVSTPIPGNTGNAILYGHNWSNILGPLKNAVPGQLITIEYNDKTKKNFRIKYTQTVKPSQIEILGQTQDNRITLYTCTGFLDKDRFVVTAILED